MSWIEAMSETDWKVINAAGSYLAALGALLASIVALRIASGQRRRIVSIVESLNVDDDELPISHRPNLKLVNSGMHFVWIERITLISPLNSARLILKDPDWGGEPMLPIRLEPGAAVTLNFRTDDDGMPIIVKNLANWNRKYWLFLGIFFAGYATWRVRLSSGELYYRRVDDNFIDRVYEQLKKWRLNPVRHSKVAQKEREK